MTKVPGESQHRPTLEEVGAGAAVSCPVLVGVPRSSILCCAVLESAWSNLGSTANRLVTGEHAFHRVDTSLPTRFDLMVGFACRNKAKVGSHVSENI